MSRAFIFNFLNVNFTHNGDADEFMLTLRCFLLHLSFFHSLCVHRTLKSIFCLSNFTIHHQFMFKRHFDILLARPPTRHFGEIKLPKIPSFPPPNDIKLNHHLHIKIQFLFFFSLLSVLFRTIPIYNLFITRIVRRKI